MIRITNLKKRLSDDFTLDIPSLTVESGERVALIGPNGSGKSTLLRLISGAMKPDEGSIDVALPKAQIGYQPQSPYVFKGTVEYNVRLGAHGEPNVGALLRACRLDALRDKKTAFLSGGERQRTCLCRMLAGQYGLLLLDEPLSAADVETGEELQQVLLDHCRNGGRTLLFATHLPAQAFALATKILIMNRGAVVEYGSPAELSAPKSDFGKRFLSQWKWG
ncbi:MAG: ABC transporter ATP-binding protein [Clostridia bacterium]|nr:ABC transporter ATP-binding protein [Clostridia bacterium]